MITFLIAISALIASYFIYGHYLQRLIGMDKFGDMPSKKKLDGVDFVPMLFITIACGAVSGFHATQSPLMARCLRRASDARPTTGDTAFRIVHMIIADFIGVPQHKFSRRVIVSIPIFAVGFGITLMDFDTIWRYFSWVN